MSETRLDIKRLIRTTIRSGRATATVDRRGGFSSQSFQDALAQHSAGRIDDAELCLEFARSKVVHTSPTFDWQAIDVDRFMPRLFAALHGDEVCWRGPHRTAADLRSASQIEMDRLAESEERFRRQMLGLYKSMSTLHVIGNGGLIANMPQYDTSSIVKTVKLASVSGLSEYVRMATASNAAFNPTHKLAASMRLGLNATMSESLRPLGAGSHIRMQSLVGSIRTSNSIGIQPTRSMSVQSLGVGPQLTVSLARLIHGTSGAPNSYLKSIASAQGVIGDAFSDRIRELTNAWSVRLTSFLPDNWRDLSSAEVDEVERIMREEGICLAWVAGPELVDACVNADDLAARRELIVQHAEEIMRRAEDEFTQFSSPELNGIVEGLIESIHVYRFGLLNPAQACVCIALTQIRESLWGFPSNNSCVKHFDAVEPSCDVAYSHYSLYVVGSVLARALVRFEPDPPAWFVPRTSLNRNLTLHKFGEHINDANYLNALMLAVSICCEWERGSSPLVPEVATV